MARLPALLVCLCLAGCNWFVNLSESERARIAAFDFYWQELADNYPLFGNSHVDWGELRQQYRAAVPYASRPHEFHHLIAGMLSQLGDPHVSFRPSKAVMEAEGVAPTSLLDREGLRVMLIEGRLHVVGWPVREAPMVPEELTSRPHYPELWRISGFPVVTSLVPNLLLGPPSSAVELQLRWHNGIITRHVMRRPVVGTRRRASVLGHLDNEDEVLRVDERHPFLWLEILTMGGQLPTTQVDDWIDAASETDGLVLDLRRNLGGKMAIAQQIVGRFLDRPTDVVFATPDVAFGPLGLVSYELFARGEWAPRGKRFDKPLVVLTSAMTASMAEHTARILQRDCGAIVIGERTAGAEAGIQTAEGPDGGQLKYGETRVVDRLGVGLQDEGVIPDIAVRLTLDHVEQLGPGPAVRDWQSRLEIAATRAIRRANANR